MKTNKGKNYAAQSVPDQSLLIIEDLKDLKKNPTINIIEEDEEEAPKDNIERINRLL